MTDVIKKAGVRDATGDYNVGGDVYEALDEEVKELLDKATERANGNGRSTVKARDV